MTCSIEEGTKFFGGRGGAEDLGGSDVETDCGGGDRAAAGLGLNACFALGGSGLEAICTETGRSILVATGGATLGTVPGGGACSAGSGVDWSRPTL